MEVFDRGYFVRTLADNFGNGLSNFFPLYLHTTAERATLLEQAGRKPNLSDAAVAYLGGLPAAPEDLFYHTLAVLHAPAYRTENAGALRQDWPRVPLPATKPALLASAALGRQIAALLDTETPVPGVATGKLRPELRDIAVFTLPPGKPLDEETDFAVTAGWGHAGKGGVTMPGRGRLETRALSAEGVGQASSLSPSKAKESETGATPVPQSLGTATHDIFLNDVACWRNVPQAVWDYTLGGYQVMKKWLSYRENDLLGRSLTLDEVKYVTEMARRIAALIQLQPALDANYAAVREGAVAG
jgi:hypothetical protein